MVTDFPEQAVYDPPYFAARSNLESFLILLTLSPGSGCLEYDGKKSPSRKTT